MGLTRMLAIFGELRTLIVSIYSAMQSLGGVITLMLMFTYFVGVYLTQIVTEHKIAHFSSRNNSTEESWGGHAEMEKLDRFYGSLDRSMLSLFEIISDGIHWAHVMEPLVRECSVTLTFVFIVYVFFAIFLLMNVITGLFCSQAMESAEEDRKSTLMQEMCTMFMDPDDQSGSITFAEFERNLQNPKMQEYLKAIDFNPNEARSLWNLLDLEKTGEIDGEQLVSGCLRLHGTAKALELAAFMHQFAEFSRVWVAHAQRVENLLSRDSGLRDRCPSF